MHVSLPCPSAACSPSQVAVRLVTDFTEYPHDFLPNNILRATEIVFLNRDGRWVPNGQGWAEVVSQACGDNPPPPREV